MIPPPWTRPRRLGAALQLGAVAALTLLAPVLLPAGPAFALETGRSTAATPPPPSAQLAVELEGTLDILHEDRDDGSSLYHHALALDDGSRVALEGVSRGLDLLTGDRVRIKGTRSALALRLHSPVVPAGAYAIAIAATSTTAPTRAGTTSVGYNVAPDGEPTPPPPTPQFLDTFDRPDSPVLDNGWAVMSGSLMIQAGEGRNQLTTTFSLAVQPYLVGATQLVAASFASANNNSAPRFGVVVRYQNPQNYYLCYRQVGGSSVLRIAKVQNGVETVLKAVGIANPAPNAFFTPSCQASGNALTLLVNGVSKLSTSQSAFTTGSAGYTISTKTGTSHRAENFAATTQ